MNYKGIPYRTQWTEFPDIEPLSKSFGIKPTGKKPDGTPYYTLPAIHDPSTNTFLADSFLIAEYLEETYPTPSIFPHGTRSLQHAFQFSFQQTFAHTRPVILPCILPVLSQRSEEYYSRTKEIILGRPLTVPVVGVEKAEIWAKFRDNMSKIDECFAKTDTKGPFIMGDTISWVDFFISAYLLFCKKIWGEKSEEWKDIVSWNEGRWGNLLHAVGNQTIH